LPRARGEVDVLRLEIAVDHAGGARGRDPGADLADELGDVGIGKHALLAQHRRQIATAQPLHHEVRPRLLARLAPLPDVRGAARRRRLELAQKALHVMRVAERRLRQHLDRDLLVAARVYGVVDLAHRAAADHLAEAIRADRVIGEPTAAAAERAAELL